VGAPLAVGGDLEGPQGGGRVSAPPAAPLLLASTSPQRSAILEQLGLPFEVVAPEFEEDDEADVPAVELVREHARGKARSVAERAGPGQPVLGVDTTVVLDGVVFGKPTDAAEAERMLERLGGRTHEVVSGLCLLTPGWEEVVDATTRVTFRRLAARDLAWYVTLGEWEGRAGGYAVQGRGAALVERIEGDYLNVVGLPAAALVRLLAERFAGTYGYG
jgi:septum formation protein